MPALPRDELLLAVAKALADHLRDGPNTTTNGFDKQDDLNALAIEKLLKKFDDPLTQSGR